MADDDRYTPNPTQAPPRQPRPGKHIWTLVKAGRRFDCEPRFHGESYGWECQLFEDGERGGRLGDEITETPCGRPWRR